MSYALRHIYVGIIRALRRILDAFDGLRWLERREGRFARWLRSLFAIYDLDDLIYLQLPWWTFAAVDHVDAFLLSRPNARVFEWGSGASTFWLAARAAEVNSVEHDPGWARDVQARLDATEHLAKLEYRHIPAQFLGEIGSQKQGFAGQFFDNYVDAIDEFSGSFDLIVIDGRAREACLKKAICRLSKGGRIVLDDFNRRRYRDAVMQTGLQIDDKRGLAVCLPLPDSTAILSI